MQKGILKFVDLFSSSLGTTDCQLIKKKHKISQQSQIFLFEIKNSPKNLKYQVCQNVESKIKYH